MEMHRRPLHEPHPHSPNSDVSIGRAPSFVDTFEELTRSRSQILKPNRPGIEGVRFLLEGNPCSCVFLGLLAPAWLTHLCHAPVWLVFLFNCGALPPLVSLLTKTVEDLALSTNALLGGLLNSVLGANLFVTSLSCVGIYLDEVALVQNALVGSILLSLLLVLGASIFLHQTPLRPGSRGSVLEFSRVGAGRQTTLLMLAVVGLGVAPVHQLLRKESEAMVGISRGFQALLLFLYIIYLLFHVKVQKGSFRHRMERHMDEVIEDDDGLQEVADMDAPTAALLLSLGIACLVCCSLLALKSVDGASKRFHVSKSFLSLVVLPLVGNISEHYTAVTAACQGKMDLALVVSLGAACQAALLVLPAAGLFSWAHGHPELFHVHPFQVSVLIMAVLLVSHVLKDKESNWLEGSILCTVWVAIAMIYFLEPEELPPVSGMR